MKPKRDVTRTGKLIGGYVPKSVLVGIEIWINSGHDRTVSTFLRQAAREKLQRDGVPLQESNP